MTEVLARVIGNNFHIAGELIESSYVSWEEVNNATLTPGTENQIIGSSGSAWVGSAVSMERFEATQGDCFIEFTPTVGDEDIMVGFCNSNTNKSSSTYQDIDFAIACQSAGTIEVYESGVDQNISPADTYDSDDVLRIEIKGADVNYYKNNTLIHSSTPSLSFPYFVKAALESTDAGVQEVMYTRRVNRMTLPAPPSDVMVHYRMSDAHVEGIGIGDGVYDDSGNGYDGTWNAGPNVILNGPLGGGISLDADDYVETPALDGSAAAGAGDFPQAEGTVSFWVRHPLWASTATITYLFGFSIAGDELRIYLDTTPRIGFDLIDTGSSNFIFESTSAWTNDSWHMITMSWLKDGYFKVYTDGNYIDQLSVASDWEADDMVFSYGTHTGGDAGTVYGDFKMWNRQLTDNEVLSLYREPEGCGYYTPQLIESGAVPAPRNHWRMNSESGGTITDEMLNIDATIAGSFTIEPSLVRGLAIDHDGSSTNCSVTAMYKDASFGFSCWIMPDNLGGGSAGRILSILNRYELHIDSDAYITARTWRSASPYDATTPAISQDTAYHVVASYGSFEGNRIYINGIRQTLTGNTAGAVDAGNADMYIGRWETDLTRNWDGTIQDIRYYERVLTDEEVISLYSEYQNYTLSSGLVAHYTMNRFAGGGLEGRPVFDETGDYDGTVNQNSSDEMHFFDNGHFDGPSVYFSGTEADNWIDIPDDIVTDLDGTTGQASVSMFINIPSGSTGSRRYFSLLAGADYLTGAIDLTVGKIFIFSDILSDVASGLTIPADVYNHIVWIVDNGTQYIYFNNSSESLDGSGGLTNESTRACIGSSYVDDTKSTHGNICNVRIYDKALSSGEVTALYNEEPQDMKIYESGTVVTGEVYEIPVQGLVGEYRGQSLSGGTISDLQGNFDGTADVSYVGTSSTGKFVGDCLVFTYNAVNTAITITSTALLDTIGDSPYSVSIWSRINSEAANDFTIFEWNTDVITFDNANNEIQGTSGECNSVIDSLWHHYIWTFTDTNMIAYKDTVLIDTAVGDYCSTKSSSPIYLGSSSATDVMDGEMDKIRIYKKQLNAFEIKQLYYEGAQLNG